MTLPLPLPLPLTPALRLAGGVRPQGRGGVISHPGGRPVLGSLDPRQAERESPGSEADDEDARLVTLYVLGRVPG